VRWPRIQVVEEDGAKWMRHKEAIRDWNLKGKEKENRDPS